VISLTSSILSQVLKLVKRAKSGGAVLRFVLYNDGMNNSHGDWLGQYHLGPYSGDRGILAGDARDVFAGVPSGSVDLIFTDPPYPKKFIYLYDWLFSEAARVLKPDGFLLVYVAGFWKDRHMAAARQVLDFFWDFTVFEKHASPVVWPRKVLSRGKSILCYRPRGGSGLPRYNVLGFWDGDGEDKRYHVWGQNENTVKYYMEAFSPPGGVVIDPFCGGGTVPVIATFLERQFLACDIDPAFVEVSRQRVEDQMEQTVSVLLRQAAFQERLCE